jgi:hypothetical protein
MRSPSVSFGITLVVSLLTAAPLAAQEAETLFISAAISSAPDLAAGTIDDRFVGLERRPTVLVPLYVSFATLQVLDMHSTADALGRGASEANPIVRSFATNPFAMAAVKAAGTAGVILASEQLWKKNKPAAIVFMVASNAAMSWVVQHNYRTAR